MAEIYSQLLQIPDIIVIIREMGAYDLYCAVVLEDFEKLFEVYEKIIRIIGIEIAEAYLTWVPPHGLLTCFTHCLKANT
jgi:hypothetical protein